MWLVTGDAQTCDEARSLLGDGLRTVAVKQGLGRFSARHVAPKRARELIQEAAAAAVSNPPNVAPYEPGRPCEIEVEVHDPDHTELYRWLDGVEIKGPRTVSATADDWWTAWKKVYVYR